MEIIKILKSLYGFGDAVSKLETFVWILNHISRSITWSMFTLKTLKYGQMSSLNMILYVMVSDYRLVKI